MQNQENTVVLNEAVVAEAASYLFWMLVDEVGIQRAIDRVDDSGGGCLLNQPYSTGVLRQFNGFDGLSDELKSDFGQAVADLVYVTTIKQGALLTGPANVEDGKRGRNLTAEPLDLAHLNLPPVHLEVNGNFETLGSLCIRHPLPAVVYSDRAPETQAGIIRIEDTRTALGFDMPMFMTNIQGIKMEQDMYMLMGEIHIPTEGDHSARMWHHAIPNSSKFGSQITFSGQDFVGVVKAHWDEKIAA